MPIYAYRCPCGHAFDEIHTSLGEADRREQIGIPCPKCGQPSRRDTTPGEAMKATNPLPMRQGVWTYGGQGN